LALADIAAGGAPSYALQVQAASWGKKRWQFNRRILRAAPKATQDPSSAAVDSGRQL